MKQIILFSCFLFAAMQNFGQDEDIPLHPVHWSYSAKKLNANSYELHITAVIDKGWHIYARLQPPSGIGLPTSFNFDRNPLVQIISKPKEIGNKETYDDKITGIKQYYYADKVDFIQTVQVKKGVKTNINGIVHFMACTNKRCLPEDKEKFSIQLN